MGSPASILTPTPEIPAVAVLDEPSAAPASCEPTADEGCAYSISYPLVIGPELIVYTPNAFTPDGDNVNDVFMPSILGHIDTSYELLIFNRWGEIIFQSQHTSLGWDGTVDGTLAPSEVYVWKITMRAEATNMDHTFQGHVTLVR